MRDSGTSVVHIFAKKREEESNAYKTIRLAASLTLMLCLSNNNFNRRSRGIDWEYVPWNWIFSISLEIILNISRASIHNREEFANFTSIVEKTKQFNYYI